jgi:nicotinate-nucleotide--dimethylbenzimidazole phosphoribosyltransferase
VTADLIHDLCRRIAAPADDAERAEAARLAAERWDSRAKPPGSLGRLEAVATRIAGITGTCPPAVAVAPAVVVFAGDHGVVADGASAWPSDITGAMVRAMAAGGAAISAFAAQAGATLTLVDVGVSSDLRDLHDEGRPDVLDRRVRAGTDSLATGPAMSRSDALAALAVGAAVADERMDAGADLLVGGDMGIGNTTSSVALVAALTGRDPDPLVGPGAGMPADGLDHKRALVRAGVERAAGAADPIEVLAEVGGLEIAALAGFHLAAAGRHVPAVVDGVIGGAALCVAEAIAPGTAAHAIGGHRSPEPAATAALEHLGLEPLLTLDLRLGEGTGACLAIPLVQAACRALRDLADLPTP